MMYLMHSTIFFMLITIKKAYSYHIFYASVLSFILSIDPRCITTSISMDILNYSIGYIVISIEFSKGTIFINSYTFEWVLLIIQCCQGEVDDSYRRSLGYSREYR